MPPLVVAVGSVTGVNTCSVCPASTSLSFARTPGAPTSSVPFFNATYQSAASVGGVSTVCGTPTDVLALKLPFPRDCAVTVFAPVVVDVSKQLPVATVPVQLSVPSLTVTFPAGVPAPGAAAATVNATVQL